MMKTIINLLLGFCFLSLCSCGKKDNCSNTQEVILNNVTKGNNKIVLSDLYGNDWDKLFVITGPRFPNEIVDIINAEYDNIVRDNSYEYIFVKNGKVMKNNSCSIDKVYFENQDGKGFRVFYQSDTLKVDVLESEGRQFFNVK